MTIDVSYHRKKIWAILMKIEWIQDLSVPGWTSCSHARSKRIKYQNSEQFFWNWQVIRKSSVSCQTVIKWSSENYREVIRQTSWSQIIFLQSHRLNTYLSYSRFSHLQTTAVYISFYIFGIIDSRDFKHTRGHFVWRSMA